MLVFELWRVANLRIFETAYVGLSAEKAATIC